MGTPAEAVSNRLTYDDEVFLRSTLVLGTPVINQTVWRFAERVDEEQARDFVAKIAAGPFNRRVRRSKVPGARPSWVVSERAHGLVLNDRVIDPDEIQDWADAQTDLPLDPLEGPLWAISLAHVSDGTSVMSHVNEHTVSDGVLKFDATLAALRGEDPPVLPGPVDEPAGLRADLADARAMARAAARGVREARRLAKRPAPVLDAQRSEDRPVPAPRPGDDEPFEAPQVLVDCPAAQWREVAARHGGTANSLLIAVTTEILLAAGLARSGEPVKVSIPVSLRGPGDWRSNATSGVSIAVPTTADGRVEELGTVRARTKSELAALADGTRRDDLAPLKPALQMLPDAAVKAYAKGLTSPLCLASNLGVIDPLYLAPFGHPVSSMVLRSVGKGGTKNQLRRMRGGVTTWWADVGEVCNLTVVGMDPDAFPDRAALRAVVERVYHRWGLAPTFW